MLDAESTQSIKSMRNLDAPIGNRTRDVSACDMISRSLLLRISNVSDESCRDNQNTHFVFNNCIPKVVSFMRQLEKIL